MQLFKDDKEGKDKIQESNNSKIEEQQSNFHKIDREFDKECLPKIQCRTLFPDNIDLNDKKEQSMVEGLVPVSKDVQGDISFLLDIENLQIFSYTNYPARFNSISVYNPYTYQPVQLTQELQDEQDKQVVIQEFGEILYLKRKLATTQNIFKGYSELYKKKVVGVIMNTDSQQYHNMVMINSYIKQTYLDIFYNLSFFQLSHKVVKSQYQQQEMYNDFDEVTTIYSIQSYYKGSFSDFIQVRKRLDKPFSTQELEMIFIKLLYLGSSLEILNLYHMNFKATKILLNFNKKTGEFDPDSIVISQLQEIQFIQPKTQLLDLVNSDIEIKFNGFNSPEISDFSTEIHIFKQNSYSIGLLMLNLLILEVFSTSRFIILFHKGLNSLENDNINERLYTGIRSLLIVDQNDRLNCVQILKQVFDTEVLPLSQQKKLQTQIIENALEEDQEQQQQSINIRNIDMDKINVLKEKDLIQNDNPLDIYDYSYQIYDIEVGDINQQDIQTQNLSIPKIK